MARFVLAGKADCPYFAKAEYLADKCKQCLPDFSIRKIPILPEKWQGWLQSTCETNGWTHEQSPLIWRDVGLGCRGILLGGLSDFLEHCQAYYDVSVEMSSELMVKIAEENMAAMLNQITEEQEHLRSLRPLHVWICSALSPVAPVLISEMLQDPEVLPESPLLSLHLLHLELGLDHALKERWEQLRALQMDTQDLAAPRLHQVSVHTDPAEAFTDADLIVFLDDDLDDQPDLQRYAEYGSRVERSSGSEVRALLFSRCSVNQKCAALLNNCPTKNKENFVTVATHLENHARVRLANKLHVRMEDVRCVLLWGDVCGQFYVDVQRAQVYNYDRGITSPAAVGLSLLQIQEIRSWCETELQQQVCEQKGALCCAHAVLCVLKAWDSPGTVLSVGVYCSGLLELPEGLVLSVPVRFSHGSWTLLPDLTIHKRIRETLLHCCQELDKEQSALARSHENGIL